MGIYCGSLFTDESIEKRKITNKEKYGYAAFNHTKGKQTKLQKYGDEKYNNREKYIQTCQEKWGVNNSYQADEIKEKSIQTCMKNYGVKYSLQSKEIREKGKQTCILRYGVENASQSEEIKRKKEETCFKHFGVKYANQNPKKFIEAQMCRLQLHQFKNTEIWYQGSYELDFLEKYYLTFPDIQRGPTIIYVYNGKNKIYYPDFYIPSLNLIVEIKNSYLAKKYKDIIVAKENATVIKNYNYIIIVDKNYFEFDILFSNIHH